MLNYKAPREGTKSSIDGQGSDQMRTAYWLKKSLTESRKDQFFMPLSRTENLPKHMGKAIELYEYVPLLDDRNINDQGLDADGAIYANGNLYGSSRDVGTITGKLPLIGEEGGKVNRVGFTRLTIQGDIQKFGFHFDFTKESIDFDSDDALMDHLSRELMNGAVQLTEAVLQIDLLNAANTVIYAGEATADSEVTGEDGDVASVVSYENLMRLDQILTDLRTPKQTKIIAGSRNIDTKVIPSSRLMYVGSELVSVLRGMKDLHGNPAFIPVQHYADAGTILNGEVGSIDSFRIIQVPEMLHWAGAGADVTDNAGYRASSGKYDIFPMLVVGSEAFATIGFQTDGKSVKFDVLTKMPGRDTADIDNDPYGERGFSSIKWYYGILVLRAERLGLIKTVAPI